MPPAPEVLGPAPLTHAQLSGHTFLKEGPNAVVQLTLDEARELAGAPSAIDCPPGLGLESLQALGSVFPGAHSKGTYTTYDIALDAKQATPTHPCVYTVTGTVYPGKGRPLHQEGQVFLAAAQPDRQQWSSTPIEVREPEPALRARLAAAWLRDAQVEHSSVAEFSRIAADLIALGAPPDLLRDTFAAAQDEIRHAEHAFALASYYADEALGPAPLPLPAHTVRGARDLAIRTFVDGCVEETVGALLVRSAAERCEDPVVQAVLRATAADESSHAALAWRTLAWILENVADREDLVAELWETVPAEVHGEDLHEPAWGRLGIAEQRSLRKSAWERIIQPLLAEIA